MSHLSNHEQFQHYQELLSCLSDGEISPLELEDLIKGLQQYPELKIYWQRLQIGKSVLKNTYEPAFNQQWHDQLGASLTAIAFDTETQSAEIIPFSKNSKSTSNTNNTKNNKFSALTNFALAASVMLVVMAGWLGSQAEVRELALAYLSPTSTESQANELENQEINNSQRAIARNININNKVLASSGNLSTEPSQTVNDLYLSKARIQDYMLLHAENASLNTNQGLLPFARMSQVSKENQF